MSTCAVLPPPAERNLQRKRLREQLPPPVVAHATTHTPLGMTPRMSPKAEDTLAWLLLTERRGRELVDTPQDRQVCSDIHELLRQCVVSIYCPTPEVRPVSGTALLRAPKKQRTMANTPPNQSELKPSWTHTIQFLTQLQPLAKDPGEVFDPRAPRWAYNPGAFVLKRAIKAWKLAEDPQACNIVCTAIWPPLGKQNLAAFAEVTGSTYAAHRISANVYTKAQLNSGGPKRSALMMIPQSGKVTCTGAPNILVARSLLNTLRLTLHHKFGYNINARELIEPHNMQMVGKLNFLVDLTTASNNSTRLKYDVEKIPLASYTTQCPTVTITCSVSGRCVLMGTHWPEEARRAFRQMVLFFSLYPKEKLE
jgi:TATA-box binding protein (TBP) (component of TFIID and TFIIIB)